jgi:hypothetical protein
MTIEQCRRHVGYVWYWVLVAKSASGEVLAWVMDVDYNRGVRDLNGAIREIANA